MKGRAVVEQQRRAGRERRDQPVPHHPAAGREVEDAIARLDVGVELMLLQVLNQRAAGAMHDALGNAGGARRVQDVERVIERQRFEPGLAGCLGQIVVPGDGVRQAAGVRCRSTYGTTIVRSTVGSP